MILHIFLLFLFVSAVVYQVKQACLCVYCPLLVGSAVTLLQCIFWALFLFVAFISGRVEENQILSVPLFSSQSVRY